MITAIIIFATIRFTDFLAIVVMINSQGCGLPFEKVGDALGV